MACESQFHGMSISRGLEGLGALSRSDPMEVYLSEVIFTSKYGWRWPRFLK
jgi:hypothetical protein